LKVNFLEATKDFRGPRSSVRIIKSTHDNVQVLQIGTELQQCGQNKFLGPNFLHDQFVQTPSDELQHRHDGVRVRLVERNLRKGQKAVAHSGDVSNRTEQVQCPQLRQSAIVVGLSVPTENHFLETKLEWLLHHLVVVEVAVVFFLECFNVEVREVESNESKLWQEPSAQKKTLFVQLPVFLKVPKQKLLQVLQLGQSFEANARHFGSQSNLQNTEKSAITFR
jgi:hypothetical protein